MEVLLREWQFHFCEKSIENFGEAIEIAGRTKFWHSFARSFADYLV